ncbi:MAG TPA: glycosyltransferase family 9 protein [Pilimelia sp.]|nr:glycosyltransferase family 9 protein [Pilimelia sp.]
MILVLRALGVGDLATAVPALRGLRAAYPGEVLALAAPAWLAPLVRLVGGVDRLLPVPGLGVRRLPGRAPRIAVNLHGRGPQSHRLLAAAAPGRLLAFASAPAGHLDGPAWRADEHEVHRWCRLLAHYGIAADPGDLALRPPPGGGPAGVTVLHPGAKAPQRRWPPERFAAVGRALAGAGHRVVVTGSAGERPLAQRVARLAGLPEAAVLAGRTDVGGLAALVARARLVVSGDTGVAHLATGYGTPSVTLFAGISPALWGPPADRPWHRAIWHGAGVGDAAVAGPTAPHPALLSVSVDEVLAAVADATRAAADRGAVAAR